MYIVTKSFYNDDKNNKTSILYVQHDESDINYDKCIKCIMDDIEKEKKNNDEDRIIRTTFMIDVLRFGVYSSMSTPLYGFIPLCSYKIHCYEG